MNLVESLKAVNTTGKPIKIKIGHTYPHRVANQYSADMRKLVKAIATEFKKEVMPQVKAEIKQRDERMDSECIYDVETIADPLSKYDDDGFRFDSYDIHNVRNDGVADILLMIRRMIGNIFPGESMALNFGGAVYQANEKSISEPVQKRLGMAIPLPAGDRSLVDAWVIENTSMIEDLQSTYLKRMQGTISRGYTQGLTYSDIAKQIQQDTDITWRRAKNIARDQVGDLNAAVTKERNEELGIKKGLWRTMQDERVRGDPNGLYPKARPSHYAREGQEFDWDEGIDGELPGQPILCRCYGESVIEF